MLSKVDQKLSGVLQDAVDTSHPGRKNIMSEDFSITEPHPSVREAGCYIHSGRGGAGNYRRYNPEDLTDGFTATGPATRISLSKTFKRPSPRFTGRGGRGTLFRAPPSEERVFQFDEEMVRVREVQAPVYYIGRGGAGNYVDQRREEPSPLRTERINSSDSAASTDSSDSSDSEDSTSNSVRRNFAGAFSSLRRWCSNDRL